jgi:hypothetical protein
MGDLIKLDSRQTSAIKHIIESLSKAHTDLSELCGVICTPDNPCLSQNAYEDIQDLKDRLESLCDQLEAPPEGTTFEDAYEETNLALGFLSALIITMWATGNPPTMRPLEWRESMMIYAVLFSTMHRLENAFNTLKQELYEGSV